MKHPPLLFSGEIIKEMTPKNKRDKLTSGSDYTKKYGVAIKSIKALQFGKIYYAKLRQDAVFYSLNKRFKNCKIGDVVEGYVCVNMNGRQLPQTEIQ